MTEISSLRKAYSAVFLAPFGEASVAEYSERRQGLLKALDEPLFFAGVEREPGSEEDFVQTWCKVIQEPAFLYLTGVNQPGCFLVLDPFETFGASELLFVPEKDPAKEFWTGLKLGTSAGEAAEAELVTGVKKVLPSEEFWKCAWQVLRNAGKASGKAGAFFADACKGDHNFAFAEKLKKLSAGTSTEVESIARRQIEMRLPIFGTRLDSLEAAQAATGEAFVECLKTFGSFKTERDLCLALNYGMQRRSDGDLAFPTIVASGKNACCLHYVKNDEELVAGDLVLLDFGVRNGSVCSDISRTIPVAGKFDPLQKLVYNAVLRTQAFHEANVSPGKFISELDSAAWGFLEGELKRVMGDLGGTFELLYDRRPHGISHFIGEQVHEGSIVGRMPDLELKPGMVISNEPGVYGRFKAAIGGATYDETIGIRIEDDLMLTEEGCRNLSAGIPKTVEELEALMGAANRIE